MKYALSLLLASLLVLSPFSDLQGHWAEKDIMFLVEKGFVSGASKDKMLPNKYISRAEVVVLAQRIIAKTPTRTGEKWYQSAYEMALKEKWIPNWSETELMNNMTRMELIKLLYQTQPAQGQAHLHLDIEQYKDFKWIQQEEYPVVQWALFHEVIKGRSDNRLDLNGYLTRSEGMVMIKRLYGILNGSETNENYDKAIGPVTYKLDKHDDTQTRLTISWGEMPTGGYQIKIVDVVFEESEIVVYYTTSAPGPDEIVTQALTYPKDSVLVDTAKLKNKSIKLIHKE